MPQAINNYAVKCNYASAKRNNKEDEDDRRKEEAAFNICSSLSVRKLPTRVNLSRRGVLLDSHLCPLCNAAMEDVQHVFFRCDVARVVLRKICRWWDLDWQEICSFSDWDAWFLSFRLSSRLKSILEGTDTPYLLDGYGVLVFRTIFYKISSFKLQREKAELVLRWQSPVRMTNTQTPPHATTVVIPTGAPATNTVANHAERPEKFNGQNFKRWQQKMFFYLTTLGLARFLKETVPQVEPPAEGQSSNAQAVQAVEAWKHSDFLCHNYVLNGLIDPLYNVYCKTTTAKELWESLERKYKTEDAGTKKFVVARFLDYKMVDSKNVISQVQDLQVLLHDIHAEGMTLSETFQVAAIIEKLPPSWVEFKNYLKHKRKEMSVEDLVVRLRIEEDNKLAQKDTYAPDSAKANMVEHAGSSSRFNSKGNKKDKKKNDKKGKGKSEYLAPKAGIVKQKFQGTCYNCDQPGHRAANCKMPKRVNPRQANMVDENVDMIAMVSDVCAMISESGSLVGQGSAMTV
ncbi:pol polyprotein [Tanacetum coccineum]|uniref:Pol polyprotein n=1 Tax=Tanacetum coccineum TaxID=301880 RepID=A0ABQ4WIZ6_9ASTR